LAYEDGDGAIRLWDAQAGREAARLDNKLTGADDKSSLALDVLSLASAPLCKQAPPAADAAGSGDEPLPPEEPTSAGSGAGSAPSTTSGSGPVTQPQ
ncbi:MAG TPA: hypothetical protein VF469_10930, partial [Kofleriaceae bacterium]